MPKAKKPEKTFEELNFPKSAKEKFDFFWSDETWTYSGLANALLKASSVGDMEDFIYCMKEEIKAVEKCRA